MAAKSRRPTGRHEPESRLIDRDEIVEKSRRRSFRTADISEALSKQRKSFVIFLIEGELRAEKFKGLRNGRIQRCAGFDKSFRSFRE